MSRKRREGDLDELTTALLPYNLSIVDAHGNRNQMACILKGKDSAMLMCRGACGKDFARECPRRRDVTDPLYVGDGREYLKWTLKRDGTLNGQIPLYRLDGEKPELIEELQVCMNEGLTSVKNLPKLVGAPEGYSVDKYYIVTYGVALQAAKDGEDIERLLVPVRPYFYGGQLKGFQGLMKAKYLTEG